MGFAKYIETCIHHDSVIQCGFTALEFPCALTIHPHPLPHPLAACGFLCPHREVLITHTFNITVIQVYAPTSNTEEANVERFYEDLQDFLELTAPTDVLVNTRDWNAKVGSQEIWPWSTEWSRAKANRVLPRECIGHSKHPLPTIQEKTLHMVITRWSILKSD